MHFLLTLEFLEYPVDKNLDVMEKNGVQIQNQHLKTNQNSLKILLAKIFLSCSVIGQFL